MRAHEFSPDCPSAQLFSKNLVLSPALISKKETPACRSWRRALVASSLAFERRAAEIFSSRAVGRPGRFHGRLVYLRSLDTPS